MIFGRRALQPVADREAFGELERWARRAQRRARWLTGCWLAMVGAGVLMAFTEDGADRFSLLTVTALMGIPLAPVWVRVRWARPRLLAAQRQILADRGLLAAEEERSDAGLVLAIGEALERLESMIDGLAGVRVTSDAAASEARRQRLRALARESRVWSRQLERGAPEIARLRIADSPESRVQGVMSERRRLGARLESFRLALLDLEMDLLLLPASERGARFDAGLDVAEERLAAADATHGSAVSSVTTTTEVATGKSATGDSSSVGESSTSRGSSDPGPSRHLATGTRSAAENLVLRGRFFWNRRTPKDLDQALGCYERALELDSRLALAHAGIADVHNLRGFYSILSPEETFPKGRAAAQRALELEADLPAAHGSLAFGRLYFDWDFAGAEAGFLRTLDLDPSYASAHHWYAELLAFTGRVEAAEEHARSALEIEPVSLIFHTLIGWVLYYGGRFDAAVEALEEGLSLDPRFAPAEFWLGLALEQQGQTDRALVALERAVDHSSRSSLMLAAAARLYVATGKQATAMEILDELTTVARQRYVPSYHLAAVHAAMGELDTTFDWLERACEERSNWMLYLEVDPAWAALRDDPRFAHLVRTVGLT